MPKSRPTSRRSLSKRLSVNAKVAPSARKRKTRAVPAANKKRSSAKVRLHQSGSPETTKPPARRIPWWVFPENERAMPPGSGGVSVPGWPGDPSGVPGLGGPGGPGGYPGTIPTPGPGGLPGPGPTPGPSGFPGSIGPGGPGGYPGSGLTPGPGLGPTLPAWAPVPPGAQQWPPGPPGNPPWTPGPPGPPPWTPSPGTVPPSQPPGPSGPQPWTPSPGTVAPPPPNWLPGTGPRPPHLQPAQQLQSAPIASPIPVSTSDPITIWISGGYAFPQSTRTAYIQYFPGLTIRQALAMTGLVTFEPGGGIMAVSGVPVSGHTNARVQYNGRVLPVAQLDSPASPNSTILLELHNIEAEY